MKNAHTRLARLEMSVSQAGPSFDWKSTKAYAAMDDAARSKLSDYVDRFNEVGLEHFTDDELSEFEQFIMPFAKEEMDDWKL